MMSIRAIFSSGGHHVDPCDAMRSCAVHARWLSRYQHTVCGHGDLLTIQSLRDHSFVKAVVVPLSCLFHETIVNLQSRVRHRCIL